MSTQDEDNGCLHLINGDRVAYAISICPDPNETQQDCVQVTIDAPYVGRVLVTCQRKRDPRWHRRFWTAVRADRIEGRQE